MEAVAARQVLLDAVARFQAGPPDTSTLVWWPGDIEVSAKAGGLLATAVRKVGGRPGG